MFQAFTRTALATALLFLSASCSGPVHVDGSTDGSFDARAEAADGVSDRDVSTGPCRADNDCSDGVFCNGVELCMPGAANADSRGCVAANPPNPCLSGQRCDDTMQRCVSICSHSPDADGDGHRAQDCGGDDCDDSDANRFPGNVEVCDAMNHDEDCDPRTFGVRDNDRDMYADDQCCNVDAMGHMNCGDDCNDSRANMHPALAEVCDGLDNNCNGMVDEGVMFTFHPDADGDGYGDSSSSMTMMGCTPPPGYALQGGDCNDMDMSIHPGALEQCDAAMVDENCDGIVNPPSLCACNGDVTRMCATAAGVCMAGTERCVNGSWGLCSIGPTPEVCNGLDDNCDGMVDEGLAVTCYPDGDNDGYAPAGATSHQTCPVPGRDAFAGCPPNQTNRQPLGVNIDCNDMDSTISPGQTELCDPAMRDENCDGIANPPSQCNCTDGTMRACMSTGSCGAGTQVCSAGQFGGCSIQPVAESCNGIDDNCNGMIDEGLTVTCYTDNDNDGFAAMGAMPIQSCPVMGRGYVGGCPTGQTNVAPAPASGSTPTTADCNDSSAVINPAAAEICDGAVPPVDENCDGTANPPSLCACSGSATRMCLLPGACAAGSQTCSGGNWGSCSIGPVTEVCNGVDDNCNGTVDEGVTVTCYPDADNDGYAAMAAASVQSCPVSGREAYGGCPANQTNRAPTAASTTDCNDAASTVNPAAPEVCDGATPPVDENCDGIANPPSLCMCSGSVTRMCALPGACASGIQACVGGGWGSCSVGPVAEVCNGVDDNCNGMTDEGLTITCYTDADNDGFAAAGATTTQQCPAPGRATVGGCPNNTTNRAPSGASNTDCNDGNTSVNPGAPEVCDGAMPPVDENCDGTANPSSQCACSGSTTRTCSLDGLSGPCAAGTETCSSGSWQSCSISPVPETCDGIDNNCNGTTDEGLTVSCYVDNDNDGYAAMGAVSSPHCPIAGRSSVGGCPTGYTNLAGSGSNVDCNDTAGSGSTIHPTAPETCNGVDDNCNGMIDEGVSLTYYRDADGDGFGTSVAGMTIAGCTAPSGYVTNNTDCNDSSTPIHPGATEICNGVDDNCNGMIDEGVTRTFYRDADADGYGLNSMPTTMASCAPPAGYVVDNTDCNDACSACHPGALEICDGNDNNCNGMTDEGVQATYYRDADGDGYGNASMASAPACSAPSGYVSNNTDCNDTAGVGASIHPGATEICNGTDDNCNGMTDEGVTRVFYRDADMDGYGNASVTSSPPSCSPPSGYVSDNTDCNDSCSTCHPGAVELCDALDNNCNGTVDDGAQITCYTDADNDTYAPMGATSGSVCPVAGRDVFGGCPVNRTNRAPTAGNVDCNDSAAGVNPGAAEVCDLAMVDENCDGVANPPALCTCSGTGTRPCPQSGVCGTGTQTCSSGAWTTCTIAPTTEVCNGLDDNCNGAVDEGLTVMCYLDADSDGYGSTSSMAVQRCPDSTRSAAPFNSCPTGYTANNTDCNDSNAGVHPGATEVCNGIDDNCVAGIDESLTVTCYVDADGDAYGTGVTSQQCRDGSAGRMPYGYCPTGYSATAMDCVDTNAAVHPGVAEVCNGLDDNCNGTIDEGVSVTGCFVDVDGDTYGTGASTTQCRDGTRATAGFCPVGFYNRGGDCNDTVFSVNPGAIEACNGIDDNCNGTTDEGVRITYYLDNDHDGYGQTSMTQQACSAPSGYVAIGGDCNDANAAVHPGAQELCDAVDNNCNGMTDEGVTVTCYADADNDTYAPSGASAASACPVSSRSSWGGCPTSSTNRAPVAGMASTIDCNDGSFSINPSASEVCNGIDDNCNGSIDEGVQNTYYRDADGDLYGTPSTTTSACAPPLGYVPIAGDCNDSNNGIHPGALELCDGIDNDCDSVIDDGAAAQCPSQEPYAVNVATWACSAGACSPAACTAPNANCDGTPGNGCESNVSTDATNCGSCGHNCGVGGECASSACDVPSGIYAGGNVSCARRGWGTASNPYRLVCWGDDSVGSLGDGTLTNSDVPVLVPSLSNVSFAALGSGGQAMASNSTDIFGWGGNAGGQLGDGSMIPLRANPEALTMTAFNDLGLGLNHSCGSNGFVYCWGSNAGSSNLGGQLGYTSSGGSCYTEPSSLLYIPVNVAPYNLSLQPIGTTSEMATWTPAGTAMPHGNIGGGNYFTCVHTATNHVQCWGNASHGRLGNGDNRLSDNFISGFVCTVGATTGALPSGCSAALAYGPMTCSSTMNDAVGVYVGTEGACAVRTGGVASCWGRGDSGQLGNGGSSDSAIAVNVAGGHSFSMLALGDAFACGLVGSGVWCWGENNLGQIGNGTMGTNSATPVQVTDTSTAALTGVTAIAAGVSHVCALKTNGEIWCWGYNGVGQLGIGGTPSGTLFSPFYALRATRVVQLPP